jgi:hypothetical protein
MRCRPLLIAGVLVAAACGPDTTATPSDSDSADEQAEPDDISPEPDGPRPDDKAAEEDKPVDAGGVVDDNGVLRFGDGDASAGPPDVVPGEIAGVVDLPESFEPYARGRAETGDTHTVTVEGELEGELGATVAWVADALREASWNAIEHDRLVEDRPIVYAEDADREIRITVNLPEDGGEGFLRVELTWEE